MSQKIFRNTHLKSLEYMSLPFGFPFLFFVFSCGLFCLLLVSLCVVLSCFDVLFVEGPHGALIPESAC